MSTSEVSNTKTKIEFVDIDFQENAVIFRKPSGGNYIVPYANVAFGIDLSEELQ